MFWVLPIKKDVEMSILTKKLLNGRHYVAILDIIKVQATDLLVYMVTLSDIYETLLKPFKKKEYFSLALNTPLKNLQCENITVVSADIMDEVQSFSFEED